MESVKGLATDKWYRALTYIAVLALVAVVAIPHDPELRKALIFLALGGLFVGLGQWIDHPYQAIIGPGGWLHGYPFRPSFFGTVLQLVGVVLVGRALWLLW